MKKQTAYYHLPGIFEFFELYNIFFSLFRSHREYFYDWCDVGAVYGAPSDCMWGGGRVSLGECAPSQVLDLLEEYKIPLHLTFSNSLLEGEHLADEKCNGLCRLFENASVRNGIIVHSELLLNYLKEKYPGFDFISSTTKVLTDFPAFLEEAKRKEFRYIVPDFRLNHAAGFFPDILSDELSSEIKDKVEFLCNECCFVGCTDRRECYEEVSRKNLGRMDSDFICCAPYDRKEYRFSEAMKSPAFIGTDDILNTYLPRGYSNFKIEGRGLGSALILEFLLYYMTKPEYRLKVREEIYLDSMLDLF